MCNKDTLVYPPREGRDYFTLRPSARKERRKKKNMRF